MAKFSPEIRDRYKHFQVIPTRWMDNDVYGHVPPDMRAALARIHV